jgi:hypothetical protein
MGPVPDDKQGVRMGQESKVRFNSPAAALRFYFRARELLEGPAGLRRSVRHPLNGVHHPEAGIIGDFLSLAACIDELDDFQLWLLSELYGPTCFAPWERTVARACEEARRAFPDRRLTPQALGRLRQQTLAHLRRRLEDMRLIAAPSHCRRVGAAAANGAKPLRVESARSRPELHHH